VFRGGRWLPGKFQGPSNSQPGKYTIVYDNDPQRKYLLLNEDPTRRPNDPEHHKLREQIRAAESKREIRLHRIRELDAEIKMLPLCSKLNNPDLDAMIMQFAMCKGLAEITLPNSELHSLYVGHEAGYRNLPGDGGDGVLITNAGIQSLNGWYERRDSTEGPPANYGYSPTNWQRSTNAPCRDCNQHCRASSMPQSVDPASPITCQTCQDVRFVGRHWYEKDDGSYIMWSWNGQCSCGWFLRDSNGDNRYVFHPPRDQVLTGQLQTGPKKWKFWRPADAEAFLGASRRDDKDNLVAQTYPLPVAVNPDD